MAIGDLLRLSVEASLHGQRTFNTFYYLQTAGGALDEEALSLSLVNAVLASDWYGPYKALHSTEWTATAMTTSKYSPLAPAGFHGPTLGGPIAPGAGTVIGGSLPSSMALVVRRRTLVAGRRGRGRVYLCGVPSAWEFDSRIDVTIPAFSTQMDALRANINSDLINGAETWSPRHYMPSAPAIYYAPIRDWTYDPVLRNQRRRQPGIGI